MSSEIQDWARPGLSPPLPKTPGKRVGIIGLTPYLIKALCSLRTQSLGFSEDRKPARIALSGELKSLSSCQERLSCFDQDEWSKPLD